jgi:magnesium-transporting ATPase (P-type)
MIVEKFGGMNGIINALRTNGRSGLRDTPDIKQDRIAVYGENKFPPPKIKTIWELIKENFNDPINRILAGAGIVSIAINLLE